MAEGPSTITGRLPTSLANDVSDAIAKALRKGMEIDEAACVVLSVACDYARNEYGDEYLESLAKLIAAQAARPIGGRLSTHKEERP